MGGGEEGRSLRMAQATSPVDPVRKAGGASRNGRGPGCMRKTKRSPPWFAADVVQHCDAFCLVLYESYSQRSARKLRLADAAALPLMVQTFSGYDDARNGDPGDLHRPVQWTQRGQIDSDTTLRKTPQRARLARVALCGQPFLFVFDSTDKWCSGSPLSGHNAAGAHLSHGR